MFDHFFITGPLPITIVKGDYIHLLVLASYLVATLGAFTGLTLASRMSNATAPYMKRILHAAGALSLGSGIWSMHFLGMLAYDTEMVHEYDPWLTILSGVLAITAAWFVLHITHAKTLSATRLSLSALLLGLGISAMHYTGMAAMHMEAETRYIPSLFVLSIIIAILASGTALWIVFSLGRLVTRRQILWQTAGALVMGLAVCGMHYTGMKATVIIPFADCRFDTNQNFFLLGMGVIAATGLIFTLSLMLGVANRMVLLAACAAVFSMPLATIVFQAVYSLDTDIHFTQREQRGVAYHEEIFDLLISLQKLRGLTYVAQQGNASNMLLLPAQRKTVQKWITRVETVDRINGKYLGTHQDWLNMKVRFAHLLAEHTSHNPINARNEFAAHTDVIKEFMTFMESVVDKSNLNSDPGPDSSLVADVLFDLMPKTTETLGQMRGLAAGYLVSGNAHHLNLSQEEKERLEGLYNQLLMLDQSMHNKLERSAEIIPDSQQFVDYRDSEVKPMLTQFMQHYNQMLVSQQTDWSAQGLFDEATAIIQAYDTLYDDMIGGFSRTLERRQAEYAMQKDLLLASGIVGAAGFIALFTFLFRSLTKTERAERDARHARQTAEQAAASKSDFLANMSHELRTPMNGVLGMAHLLADTPLGAEQKEFVSIINGSAENLLMLLNDILDFSKIEAGALVFENIAFDVNVVINGAVSLLQPQANKKNLDLHVEVDPEVPAYSWGDPGRLRQIITNLMGNAIKFTETGYVRLAVKMQEHDGGNWLHISVQDTGIGIPADKAGEMFEKFTQADASVTRKFGGTGLGLAITKQLVTLMGGHIGVESVEGKGSTFWFTLPCKAAKATDEVTTIDHLRAIAPNTNQHKMPIGNARALLVDDYPVNQVFAEKLLRKFGLQHIDKAGDGFEALMMYNEHNYDIIFMDCQMPRMDGYITTQEIRAREASGLNHTIIVAMTANAMMGDREKCLKSGMDDYLSKPLRANHLKMILEAWFTLEGARSVIEATKPDAAANAEDVPVDMAQLRIFTDGDPEEEKALFALFLEQAQVMIDLLAQSTSENAHEVWKSAAHRFKGSSGNLGAMKLHHLCKRAETHSGDNEQKKKEMLSAIMAETGRVRKFCHG